MTRGQSDESNAASTADWPTFGLTYTYNPSELALSLDLCPDELVVFEPDDGGDIGENWITAERGSYLPIEDAR